MEKNVGICTLCGEPVKKSDEDHTEDGELVHASCHELLLNMWEADREIKLLMGF